MLVAQSSVWLGLWCSVQFSPVRNVGIGTFVWQAAEEMLAEFDARSRRERPCGQGARHGGLGKGNVEALCGPL